LLWKRNLQKSLKRGAKGIDKIYNTSLNVMWGKVGEKGVRRFALA
jgi:hypothetical protein